MISVNLPMKNEAYLNCINFNQPVRTDLSTLVALQRNHLLHVPFENLDIHYQRPIRLDLDAVFDKVVMQKRGGFCYELNSIFYALLRELGFQVSMISARVHKKEGDYSPEFDHMALLVTVDNVTYLVDVGFGSFSLEPLLLREEVVLKDPYGNFTFDSYQGYFRINLLENEKYIPQYIFTTQPRKLEEFSERCYYHQYNPESHFSQKKVISLALEDGRITLNDDSLKVTKKGEILEESFDPFLFEKKLEEFFCVSFPKATN